MSFIICILYRIILGPTQPPIQWVPGTLSLGVKRSGREADHSPPSSTEVKNALNYTSTPTIRLYGVVLYPQGKSHQYPLDGRLGGAQSRSGRSGKEKVISRCPGTRTPDHPAGIPELYQPACMLN
jgi:hypothetical protein